MAKKKHIDGFESAKGNEKGKGTGKGKKKSSENGEEQEVKKKAFKMTEGRQKTMNSFGIIMSRYSELKDSQIENWRRECGMRRKYSIKSGRLITKPRLYYNYINLNLYEIGEPPACDVPHYGEAQKWNDFIFEFISEGKKQDMILHTGTEIEKDSKFILSATHSIKMGHRRLDKSWFKKIDVIDSNFKTGTSILAQYLRIFKKIDKDMYKIAFKYRAVNRISGMSGPEYVFEMYSDINNR